LHTTEAIAEQLSQWLETKQQQGSIPALPQSAVAGLSREEQARVLERFLQGIVELS
jgi:hypothetical protein